MPKLNSVELADCFDYLAKLKAGSVDLAVIDPPYNLGKADWDTFKSEAEFYDFTYRWIKALLPSLKADASLYIFNTPHHSAYISKFLDENGLHFQNWITWDKRDGFASTTKRYVPTQETILFYSRSKQPYFDAEAVRQPYRSAERIAHAANKGILKNGKRWFPNPNGRLSNDVWHIVSDRHKNKVEGKIQKSLHVTTKPLEMIERIILSSSRPGDTVLDCFMGSGTTAVAAQKLGRNFLGCDNDPDNIKIAETRLSQLNSHERPQSLLR
jgi:site-specific DNA-methyltransferase (adenine-specific)